MATVAAPYGFKPVNRIDGLPYSGVFRQIKIASTYGTNIFNGSVVAIATAGTLEIVDKVGSSAGNVFPAGTVGIFVGCSYTDATYGLTFKNYWPSGTIATDAVGYVIDDPNVLFQVQCAGSLAQTDLGANAILNAVQSTSTGSTVTGNSNTAINPTTATTATYAFKIVDFVKGPTSTVGDAYTDVLVKFNPGSHAYLTALGI